MLTRRQALAALGASVAWPAGARADELIERSPRPENYETPVERLGTRLTPIDAFYVRSHFDKPAVDLATWRLSLDGLGEPRSWSFAELSAMPQTTVEAVLQCSGNGRALFRPRVPGVQWKKGAMGNAEWRGVRLVDLLKSVAPEAKHLILAGADRPVLPQTPAFVRSIPIERALDPSTLVALRMNGEPLPPSHGAPARLVVPGWVGDDWVKWLSKLSLSAEEAKGFFFERAYRFPDGPIEPGAIVPPERMRPMTRMNVKSVIAQPSSGERVPLGELVVTGVAFSGEVSVRKLELSLDGGPWTRAKLDAPSSRYGWQRFEGKVTLTRPGPHTLAARATDERGDVQPAKPAWNPSGYLYNAIDTIEIVAGP